MPIYFEGDFHYISIFNLAKTSDLKSLEKIKKDKRTSEASDGIRTIKQLSQLAGFCFIYSIVTDANFSRPLNNNKHAFYDSANFGRNLLNTVWSKWEWA